MEPGRSLYRYMKAHRAVEALATRKLRWSSPILFNDPFDSTQELRLNFDSAEFAVALTGKVATMVEQGDTAKIKYPMLSGLFPLVTDMPSDRRRELARRMREQLPQKGTPGQDAVLKELKDKWSELVPTFRVLCLSELNDVAPMWAHYTDNQSGIVLEFATTRPESVFGTARPVIYQDEAPAIGDPHEWADRMLMQRGYADLFVEYAYVKKMSWSYEKEWRIVVFGARDGETEPCADYGFNDQDLVGVYFGLKCSDETRADVRALLGHGLGHVRAYEAVPDMKAGRLTFKAATPRG